MENEKKLTETAVETAYDEEREQHLADQQEAERMEQNFENARERAEEKEKSDAEYLVECMNLPF
jgi:hypothetical protein